MYMADNEIIAKVAEYTGLSFNKLAKEIGLTSPQTFYDIKAGKHGISKELAEKIQARYLNINIGWLLTGNGDMLKTEDAPTRITEMVMVGSTEEIAVDIEALQNDLNITTSQLATIINDSEEYLLKCQGKLLPRHIVALELNYGEERISKYVTLPNQGTQVEIIESFPVLPEAVNAEPNVNIEEVIEEDGIELEAISPNLLLSNMKVSVAVPIKGTSMLPTFQPNDWVFVRFLKDKMKIVSGKTYYLKCRNRPTMIRRVKFESEDKLRLIAKNSEYDDIIICRSDIINIGNVVALFRMTFGDQYSELEALRREKDAEREKKDSQIDKMLEMMQAQGEQQSKLIDYITKER